jgi:hypothetical protein
MSDYKKGDIVKRSLGGQPMRVEGINGDRVTCRRNQQLEKYDKAKLLMGNDTDRMHYEIREVIATSETLRNKCTGITIEVDGNSHFVLFRETQYANEPPYMEETA